MKLKKEGQTLTITVELEAEPKPSTSGRSLIYYTSHGFVYSDELGMGINLTIIKRRGKRAEKPEVSVE